MAEERRRDWCLLRLWDFSHGPKAFELRPPLEAALAELWPDAPVQRCTVHKHRNLLAHAPKALHDELTEDYRDMIYAETKAEVEARRGFSRFFEPARDASRHARCRRHASSAGALSMR